MALSGFLSQLSRSRGVLIRSKVLNDFKAIDWAG